MRFKIGERELEFNEETKNIFYKDKTFSPSIRTYGDMKDLYSEKEAFSSNEGLYYMYRDIYFDDLDKEVLKYHNIRYDITIMLPYMFGNEYNKTYGHYHPQNKAGNDYQEIYQVLHGEAIYLQQNSEKVFFTNAFSGDKVVMLEGFGHVTINPSKDDILVMANLVDNSFTSLYNDYKNYDGANYLYKTTGFEINPKYNNDIKIDLEDELFDGEDMYDNFLDNPEKFNFLK